MVVQYQTVAIKQNIFFNGFSHTPHTDQSHYDIISIMQ